MGLLERSRIPIWVVPEQPLAQAIRDRGLQPDDLVEENDAEPGVLLRAEIGEQMIADATTLWRAARSLGAEIPFQVELSAQTQWCWAAVAISIAREYHTPSSWRSQCQVVNDVLPGAPTCCSQGDSAVCNVPSDLETPLTNVEVDHASQPGSVSFGDVQTEINNWRLLCVRLQWSNGGGHFVVVKGWLDDPLPMLTIEDPDPMEGGYKVVEFDALINGDYLSVPCTWTDSYFTVRPPIRIRVPDEVWAAVGRAFDQPDPVYAHQGEGQ